MFCIQNSSTKKGQITSAFFQFAWITTLLGVRHCETKIHISTNTNEQDQLENMAAFNQSVLTKPGA